MRIIVFNGPLGSGKSTAARFLAGWLKQSGANVITDSFAAPMKHLISTLLGAKYMEMPKDVPVAELRGDSVRQFLIWFSEEVIKPRYGADFFGRMLLYRALRYADNLPDYVVVDDSGFDAEFGPVSEDATLIRVVREGCSYVGDSRGYLTVKNPDYVLLNNKGMTALDDEMRVLAQAIMRFEL